MATARSAGCAGVVCVKAMRPSRATVKEPEEYGRPRDVPPTLPASVVISPRVEGKLTMTVYFAAFAFVGSRMGVCGQEEWDYVLAALRIRKRGAA